MNSVDKKTTGAQQNSNIKTPADKQGFDKKQNLGNSSLDQKQDRTSTGKSADFQQDQKRASSLKDY